MGRFRESLSESEPETGIDMSPLIDCVFILLIFFIVTTVFVEETGVSVDKPEAAQASDLDKNSILIAITSDGKVVFNKREIGVRGVQSIVKQRVQKEMMPVIIQADELANVGVLSRVIGEAKLGGAEIVNLAASNPGS